TNPRARLLSSPLFHESGATSGGSTRGTVHAFVDDLPLRGGVHFLRRSAWDCSTRSLTRTTATRTRVPSQRRPTSLAPTSRTFRAAAPRRRPEMHPDRRLQDRAPTR